MPEFYREKNVPYSREQMFSLVNDVAQYPNFLPWCSDASIISHHNSKLTASLTISKGGITQSFTTENMLTHPSKTTIKLVNGPFSSLEGKWSFIAIGAYQCQVIFHLEYKFSSIIVEVASKFIISSISNQIFDCFCQQADKLYQNSK